MIEPDIDAYGTYARASCLADYAELLALKGSRFTMRHLEDLIDDNGWQRLERQHFRILGQEEDAGEWVATVETVLAERTDILGDRYPFAPGAHRLEVKAVAAEHEPYLLLLAVTVAHAMRISVPIVPARALEALVASFLQERALRAVDFGSLARGSSFPDALTKAGAALALRSTPGSAPVKRHAHDAGVDTLGHLWLEDSRHGRWTFLGQATCARSDGWEAKMSQPSPSLWASYLGEVVAPQVFLAVPHHVETGHLGYLAQAKCQVVLDRLRLSRLRRALTPEERSLLDAVLAADVLDPAA